MHMCADVVQDVADACWFESVFSSGGCANDRTSVGNR